MFDIYLQSSLLSKKALFALAAGGITLAFCYLLRYFNIPPFSNDVPPATPDQLRHIPLLQFDGSNDLERYVSETRSLLRKGYDKYLRQGVPFQIRHPVEELGAQVLLPPKYLDEVKKAPTDLFSFEAYSEKSFLLNYSRAPRQTEAAAHIIRVDLNRNLGKLTRHISPFRYPGGPSPICTKEGARCSCDGPLERVFALSGRKLQNRVDDKAGL